jgi:UDP-GlcNAc:undecaprenyl-phosphate GlcNAc-1-phosphate transferase
MDNFLLIQIVALVFVASFGLNAAIWGTRRWQMSAISRRADERAVQSSHAAPTPRLGGVAIVAALVLGSFWIPGAFGAATSLLLLCLVPLLAGGLWEDFGYRVSPRRRVALAALSTLLAVAAFGIWVDRVGVPGADWALGLAPVGVAFTVFAVVGVTNAFNLIDGINGLSVSISLLVAASLGYVAAAHGVSELAQASLVLMGALGGFLFINYPFGKVFLGDAGAYSVGFILASLAVALMHLAPEVNPAAVLLIFFWPVADTVLAIYRRRVRGQRSDKPDRLHFHQLTMRALEIALFGRRRRALANPLATAIIVPMAATPMLAGVALSDNNAAAFAALLVFAVLFFTAYNLGINWARRRPNRSAALAAR